MSATHTDTTRLTVDYHDGRSEQAQPVTIWVSQGMLELAGHGVLRQAPIHQVHWPDPHRQEDVRLVLLPGGGSLRGHDVKAWDAWQAQQRLARVSSTLEAPRQGWRWSLVATLLLLALCAASYVFALPSSSG